MAAHWLDVFARRIQSDLSRRNALVLLAGALASGSAFPQPTLAGNGKKVGKKCDKNKDCIDGAKCKKDECKCKNRFTKCNKKCYDLDKDEKHCGACNTRCTEHELCLSGVCINPNR
jgi:hypothetical protein